MEQRPDETPAEYYQRLTGNLDRLMEEAKPSAFDTAEFPQIVVIELLRIYDVLMAILHNTNASAAQDLFTRHSNGEILGPPPAFTMKEEE